MLSRVLFSLSDAVEASARKKHRPTPCEGQRGVFGQARWNREGTSQSCYFSCLNLTSCYSLVYALKIVFSRRHRASYLLDTLQDYKSYRHEIDNQLERSCRTLRSSG